MGVKIKCTGLTKECKVKKKHEEAAFSRPSIRRENERAIGRTTDEIKIVFKMMRDSRMNVWSREKKP